MLDVGVGSGIRTARLESLGRGRAVVNLGVYLWVPSQLRMGAVLIDSV